MNVRWIAAILLFATQAAFAQGFTPEQERVALIRSLQARMGNTGPNDWIEGGVGAESGTAVIALSSENATNTHDILSIGKKAWDRKFKNGKTLASCFPQGGKRVAITYPLVDTQTNSITTFEMALLACYQKNNETELPANTTLGPLVAYARSLSEGQKMTVRVAGNAAQAHFDAGRRLFHQRMGQQNFACASCHVQHAGKVFGESALSPVVGQAVTWPRVEPGGRVRTLQMQFQRCMEKSSAIPYEVGSQELNQLEYYHAFLSNTLPIRPLMPLH